MSDAARYAVVTGAAGGIGRAIVKEFHAAGFRVIATDRQPKPDGMECAHFIQVDVAQTVSDATCAAEVFGQIRELVDDCGLKALINNAAVQILGGVRQLTREDWRQTLDVNLVAPFVWTQGLLNELQQARGSVVNVSSIHARLTKRNFVAYATSKAALSGMTRAMAVDLGGMIRVNAIEPAAIETDMLKAGFAGKEAEYDRLQQFHPQGRIGRTGEVAACALAIVDGRVDFLHGACITLDGGIGGCLLDPA
jgi:NAD(P)-dependent dehydrogenase (short-subunit alcohol dehydrogenase family)